MPLHDSPITKPSLIWAIVASLLFHGLILFVTRQPPRSPERQARRIEATLAPRPSAPLAAMPPATVPAEIAPAPTPRQHNKMLLAPEKSSEALADAPAPAWSKAEREDMDKFLRELDDRSRAGPGLAQRSLAMAHAVGRQRARQDDDDGEMLERLPDSPPVDPVSLEMYLDGLVNKLNRSAAFVKNDPRSRGMKTATVLIRLNPNGSLQSFKVLNAADQQVEIAYIEAVVQRAVPFPAFPADIRKSARSLAMFICILPAHLSGGGFGFSRTPDGRGC